MKERIEAILSSDKDFRNQLQELDKLFDEIVSEIDSPDSKQKKKKYTPEAVSIHDFEPIGLFAD